jgi:serine/threonine protein kinase
MNPEEGMPSTSPILIADRYELGETIGRGAMGEVHAGRDLRLGRDVAIKVLRADMAGQPSVRQRFEAEARLAARLLHPNVVAVFDCGEHAGVPYVVMERLSGRTLADDIAAGPLDSALVRTIGVQILDALGAAHAAGVVHRDVKPGNVLAATPGCWKVGDFGIAKSLEVSDPTLTVAGMVIGTPAYLAPERLAGGPATVSSDLYAAGVVLYEALTGRRPVKEGAPVAALAAATPTPLHELRPDVPMALAQIVMRAIARDPTARFDSAHAMAEALRRPKQTPMADTVQVPSAAPTTVSSAPPTQVFASAPLRRRPLRRAAGGLIALVLLVAVILGIALSRHHSPTPASSPPTTALSPTNPVAAPLEPALQQLERAVRP